jgi:hypothetical protein
LVGVVQSNRRMDPISLGMALAALIASKALDRAGDEAVDAGASGVGRLVAAVRARLGRSADAGVQQALARVDDAPDSPARERELAAALGGLLERDPDGVYEELRELWERAERDGVQLTGPISQTASGSGPTAQLAGNLRDIDITQN